MLGSWVLHAGGVILAIVLEIMCLWFLGGFDGSAFGYLRQGGLVCFPIPYFTMSFSDQHPYTLFVAGGLRSPSLAKAQVEVGVHANTYLASADVVSFIGRAQFVEQVMYSILPHGLL